MNNLQSILMNRELGADKMSGSSGGVGAVAPTTEKQMPGGISAMMGKQMPSGLAGMMKPTVPTGGMPASVPNSGSASPNPAWQRFGVAQQMQEAYRNNWQPNPMLIQAQGGVKNDQNQG
jgi:hypothetical protein